jgi:hypothetical protein
MSEAPPFSGAPGGGSARELVLALEGGRGWRRRGGDDRLVLSALGVTVEHGRLLREPLHLPLGAIAVGCVDPGPARAGADEGRLPVLRRLGPNAVVPRSEGIEGWLWTGTGGSGGLTALGEDDEAPNAALVFAKPLGEEAVARAFDPDFVTALAARSPLGLPAVHGLLFRVRSTLEAERAFARYGLGRPLTDREVPPTLRRSLPGDRAADPRLAGAEERRAAHSVAPPGMG